MTLRTTRGGIVVDVFVAAVVVVVVIVVFFVVVADVTVILVFVVDVIVFVVLVRIWSLSCSTTLKSRELVCCVRFLAMVGRATWARLPPRWLNRVINW